MFCRINDKQLLLISWMEGERNILLTAREMFYSGRTVLDLVERERNYC